jgi:hypothetical protein
MKTADMTPIIKKYQGCFVALSNDRKKVLGIGLSPEEALKAARDKGFANPIMAKIPKNNRDYK